MKVLTIAGIVFIILGLAFVEWTTEKLIGVVLPLSVKIIIWGVQIVLIGFGSLLIYFRTKARIQINMTLSLSALVLCLLLAEGLLQLMGLPSQKQEVSLFMQNPNGTGSYRLKPVLDGVRKVGSKDYFNIKTNSLGMPWREVIYDNPSGKTRIAFAGDSFTFGCWADSLENSFVAVFESSLKSEKFEALNFGVPGYGLTDILLQLKEQILPFKPDYLILIFFTGNDFRDTFLGNDKYDLTTDPLSWNITNMNNKIPEEFRASDSVTENVVIKHTMIKKIKSFMANRSLYKIFNQFVSAFTANHTDDNKAPVMKFSISDQFTSYSFWSQTVYPEVALKAKDLSLEVLENIRELCSVNNIQLIIVALPFREQVYASSLAGCNYDINYPQKYVEEYSVTHSLMYLDLLPPLRVYIKENNINIYSQDDTHLNNNGHKVVGELIAKFFVETSHSQTE